MATSTKKTKKSKEPVVDLSNPAWELDAVSCILTRQELHQLTQYMWFCADTFNKLTLQATTEEEIELQKRRTQISLSLHSKLKSFALIGEPETKQIH